MARFFRRPRTASVIKERTTCHVAHLVFAEVSDGARQKCCLAGDHRYIDGGRVERRFQTQHYRHTHAQTDERTNSKQPALHGRLVLLMYSNLT